MKRLTSSCIISLTLALSSGALAQTPPAAPAKVMDVSPGIRNMSEFDAERNRRLTTPGGEEIDREALANQVAALIDQGQCQEARQVARQAGDRAMSRRIGQICREGQGLRTPPPRD